MEPAAESDAFAASTGLRDRSRPLVVPLMLSASSLFMSLAWIGHLRFRELPFLSALGICWLLVLPEYALNVKAIRLGHVVYTGAQMAAFRLCSGVVFVALTARCWLNEELGPRQLVGFAIMLLAMLLIAFPEAGAARAGSAPNVRDGEA